MIITRELNTAQELRDIAWSGASATLDDLTDEQIEEVLNTLEGCYSEMDETELNDFLWFERDTIAEWLGFESYDALMHQEEIEELEEELEEKEETLEELQGELEELEEEENDVRKEELENDIEELEQEIEELQERIENLK